MRHLNDKTYLNRSAGHRTALISNMSAALFLRKRIITTIGKARYIRKTAERMITFARRGDLAARRHVMSIVHDPIAVHLLFEELGPHFKTVNGGYTRIIKMGTRRGDAAEMVVLELTGFNVEGVEADDTKDSKSKSRLKIAQKAAKTTKAAKVAPKAK